MSEETFVKSSSLLFPSSEGLGVGSALEPYFLKATVNFTSPGGRAAGERKSTITSRFEENFSGIS
ncbi:MAG: hypothetical protein F6K14_30370 [Symploca sp. SIO2C1]|nr:hypothetical protein [Symploca sp. SIO2C1]